MSVHIAIDVGGTRMRAAAFHPHSEEPISICRLPTKDENIQPTERLIQLIETVWPENDRVAGIGIAAPGPLNPYTGLIIAAPNIPDWQNIPLASILEERFKVEVKLGNDANLAALGEWNFGAGKGHHNLIYITVSTGVGGGIIVDDRLLIGAHGLGAELGHVTVLPGGPQCSCGQFGHLEAVASGTAIARWVEEEIEAGTTSKLPPIKPLSTRDIAAAAKDGDDLAKKAFTRAGAFLGQAVADFLHIFNPTMVIIGGGVSQSGDLLLKPLQFAMQKHVLNPHYLDDMTLSTSKLKDDAGLYGALTLARKIEPDTK